MTTIAIQAFPFRAVARPVMKPRLPQIDLSRSTALADTAASTAFRFSLALVPFGALAWLFVAF